jgi:hypothetical protein
MKHLTGPRSSHLWLMALGLLSLITPAGAALAQGRIDDQRNIAGMWLDADRAAQGIMLEQLDPPSGAADGGATRIGVSWYTWAPAGDRNPGPRWLFGIGRRSGDTIVVDSMQIAKSGSFLGNPVAPATLEHWGRLRIVFQRDSGAPTLKALVAFEGPAGWGAGNRTLKLITQSGHGADYNLAFSPPLAPFMVIGTYSHPPYVGQGWVLNQYGRSEPSPRIETTLLWYTYGPDGQPTWMFGIDADLGDGARFEMMRAVSGGTFEGTGVPRLEPWGQVTIWGNGPPPALTYSCVAEDFLWESPVAGFGNGAVEMARITRPYEPQVGPGLCFSM